jgi:hypothetical protein
MRSINSVNNLVGSIDPLMLMHIVAISSFHITWICLLSNISRDQELLNIVNALRDLGPVDTGVSNSRFFSCDNEKEYVVKFVESSKKTAINELVGGTLAMALGLPTPEVVQVNISQNVIDVSDDLRKRKIQTGLHIGIERLPKEKAWSFNYINEDMLRGKTLINGDKLYGVISFDNWLINDDRDNKGNNMIEFLPNEEIRYVMIDFGHCFTGNAWDKTLDNNKNSVNMMRVFYYIKWQIKEFNDFIRWFNQVEGYENLEIDKIMESIPQTWNLTEDERIILFCFIRSRKHLIRKIITNNRQEIEKWQLV